MALAGPRLDRPSAVGDEGRPRAVSLWIASVVVVALVGIGGVVVGQPGLLPSLGTSVGLVVAGVVLVQRERFGLALAGYVLFALFGGMLLVALPLFLVFVEFGVAVAGLAVALLGIGVAWGDVTASEGLKRVAIGTGIAYLSMVATLMLAATLVGLLVGGRSALASSTAGVTPIVSVTWFVVAVGYAGAGLRVALWALPVEQLLQADRRESVERRLRRARRGTLLATLSMPVAIVFLLLLTVAGVFETLEAVAPATVLALDALASPVLLGPLAALGSLALLASLVAGMVRSATRRFDSETARWVAAVAAGVVLAALATLTAATTFALPTLNNVTTTVVVGVTLLVVPPVLVLLVFGVLGVVVLDLLPDRAGGPALAATGLVLATVGFARGPPVLAFGCVAGAAVVWDASWFGLGLTAELGHVPETRRLELVHGVAAVGLGALAVGVLTGLELVRTSAGSGIGDTVAVVVAGIGVLLLLLPLRG